MKNHQSPQMSRPFEHKKKAPLLSSQKEHHKIKKKQDLPNDLVVQVKDQDDVTISTFTTAETIPNSIPNSNRYEWN